jgi:hypothetical protein
MAERTSLKQIRDTGKRKKAGTDIGVIGALADAQFREDVLRGLGETSARGVAGVLGAPVDLTTMALRPFGYSVPAEQVVGGSDYIGRQMERAGLISGERRPIAEMLGGIVSPDPADAAKLGAMFIGPLAKTWDAAAAQKAVDMEAAGVDPRKIWEETGTWRGPDKMLRQEISDESAVYRPGKAFAERHEYLQEREKVLNDAQILRNLMDKKQIKVGEAKRKFSEMMGRNAHEESGLFAKTYDMNEILGMSKEMLQDAERRRSFFKSTQGEVFQHPELYSSYPDIEDMAFFVRPEKQMQGSFGAYNPSEDYISMLDKQAYALQSGKSTNLHELQHAIQQRENFSSGGSPEMFLNQESPYDQYRRLAGEVEARATQARMNLTPQQRRSLFPEESYDVPIRELIVLPRSGK